MRALIVEDHPLMAQAIGQALSGQGWIEVVSMCNTADDAVSCASSLIPDVLVLDLRLGRPPQLADETAKRLIQVAPSARIVVYSAYVTRPLVLHLTRIGVYGYVSKSEPTEVLVEAVAAASRGHAFYPSEVRALAKAAQTEFDEGAGAITPREAEAIQLIAEGHTNPEIARRLSISLSAVIKLVGIAARKLGATNRHDLVLRAVRAGLVIIDE